MSSDASKYERLLSLCAGATIFSRESTDLIVCEEIQGEFFCFCIFNDDYEYTQRLIDLLKERSIDSRVSINSNYREGIKYTKTFVLPTSHEMSETFTYPACEEHKSQNGAYLTCREYESQINARLCEFAEMLKELLLEREAITISKVMVTSKTEAPHDERTTSLTLFVSPV